MSVSTILSYDNKISGTATLTIPDAFTSIEENTFANDTNLVVVNCNNIKLIGAHTFSFCAQLTDVRAQRVEKIDTRAFYKCKRLKRLEHTQMLALIAEGAFAECESLTHAYLPPGTRECDTSIYKHCVLLQSLVIANGCTIIPYNCFHTCLSLKSVALPESIVHIDDYAFYGCCKLSDFVLPNTLTHIGMRAFASTGCVDVNVPHLVTHIEQFAFSFCPQLKSITFGKSITCISCTICSGCENLTSITFSDNIECIYNSAFVGCQKLRDVTVPHTVRIYPSAFCTISRLNGARWSVHVNIHICFVGSSSCTYTNRDEHENVYLASICNVCKYYNVTATFVTLAGDSYDIGITYSTQWMNPNNVHTYILDQLAYHLQTTRFTIVDNEIVFDKAEL